MTSLKITAFILKNSLKPFKWGQHDCAHFVTEWIKKISGKEVFVYPKYSTEHAAYKYCRKHGGFKSLVAHTCHKAGFPTVEYPRVGDIIFQPEPNFGGILGIYVGGNKVVHPRLEGGIATVELHDDFVAWEVAR
ncbi:MAG: C40 family peptidase [Opitutales bacterium]|nr:C40 family peptidase [Opitutales bacterium]